MEEIEFVGYVYNATPSWNGYSHQGKVALYVVLKMINDQSLNREQCSEYELELDYFEDFSILKNDVYIEAHQVKTYSDSKITKYNDAIWTLLAKAKKIENCNVYLHTTTELEHRESIPNEVSMPKVETRKKDSDLLKPYEYYQFVTEDPQWKVLWERFTLFSYANNQHCELESIKEFIESEIYNFKCDFSQNITRAYSLLLRIIDLNVCARHIQNQDKKRKKERKERISFQTIYDIVNKNHDQPTLEYCISVLKERFHNSINRYLQVIEVEEKHTAYHREKEHELYKRNISFIYEKIMKLEDLEFLNFFMTISPQQTIDKNNPRDFDRKINELFAESEMINGYLPILDKIEQLIHEEKYWFSLNNTSYLPTTIVDGDSVGIVATLVQKILNNSISNDELLFEVDYIINKFITRGNLYPEKVTKEYEEIEDTDQLAFKKYTTTKKIQLIKLENAIEEFTNDKHH